MDKHIRLVVIRSRSYKKNEPYQYFSTIVFFHGLEESLCHVVEHLGIILPSAYCHFLIVSNFRF